MRGTGATGDQNLSSPNQLRSCIVSDLDRVGVNKSRFAFKGCDVVTPKLRLDDLDFAGHDGLRPKDQIRHHDAVFQHITTPVKCPLLKSTQIENSLTQGFAGNGAGVNADTANGSLPVDDCDFLSEFCRTDGALLSRGSASDNHQIVFVRVHAKS